MTILICGCATIKVSTKGETMNMSFKSDAKEVLFYSSANGFAPIKAKKDDKWQIVTIKKTAKMKYFLKADGKIYLPDCKMKEQDDFGGDLCIYER